MTTDETYTPLPQLCGPCAQVDGYRRAKLPELMGGDECESCGYAPRDARQMAVDQLRRTVYRALDAGATQADIMELFAEVLDTLPPDELFPPTVILWPECW